MNRKRALALGVTLVLMLLVVCGPVLAAPVKTNLYGLDGLFIGTGAGTIPAGELVVGGSMMVTSDDIADGSFAPVTVTFGATDIIEIAAAFEVYKSYDTGVSDDKGTGDLYLAAKMAIQEETADYPATAVGLRVKLAMADDLLGTDENDLALFAAMETDMKGVRGLLNVEYLIAGGDYDNQVNYVVGLEIPYSETTDFTLELMDQTPSYGTFVPFGDIFAAGATFDMGSALNFGVAVGAGLGEDSSADFVAMGKLAFTF